MIKQKVISKYSFATFHAKTFLFIYFLYNLVNYFNMIFTWPKISWFSKNNQSKVYMFFDIFWLIIFDIFWLIILIWSSLGLKSHDFLKTIEKNKPKVSSYFFFFTFRWTATTICKIYKFPNSRNFSLNLSRFQVWKHFREPIPSRGFVERGRLQTCTMLAASAAMATAASCASTWPALVAALERSPSHDASDDLHAMQRHVMASRYLYFSVPGSTPSSQLRSRCTATWRASCRHTRWCADLNGNRQSAICATPLVSCLRGRISWGWWRMLWDCNSSYTGCSYISLPNENRWQDRRTYQRTPVGKGTLNRESIDSQCLDIHRNSRISKWISIKALIIEEWYP